METIFLHAEDELTVLAEFSPGVNRLLIDDLDFGFALKQTLKVLNISPEIPNPRNMILRGGVQDVATYTPWLEEAKYTIAARSSVELSQYRQERAVDVRNEIAAALDDILAELPSTLVSGNFMDVCQVVLEPFGAAVLPAGNTLKVEQFYVAA